MKRSSGAGRRKVPVVASRSKFECLVCKKTFRADKLKEHYNSKVKYLPDGHPVPSYSDAFKSLNEDQKRHTQYFIDNQYSIVSHPPNRVIAKAAARNPFKICHDRKEKRVKRDEDEDEEEGTILR